MASYRFFPVADARQDAIWDYTCAQWGESQAIAYIHGLHAHLQQLADRTLPWRPLPRRFAVPPDLDLEIFFSHYQRHYIFFRVLSSEEIGIMTILHDAMQIPVRLREDLGRIEGMDP
jgi:toxin ParE1/3/4